MQFEQGEANYENVYHVTCEVVPSVGLLDTIANAFTLWEMESGKLNRSNDVSLVQVKVTDLTSLDGPTFTDPVNPPIVGNRASQALPANATFAVKADIGKRGRGRAGRVFWVGLAEDQVDENTVTDLARVSIVDALNELITVVDAIPACTLAVLSRYLNGALRDEGIGFTIVTFSATDNVVDSQRNRLPNHRKRTSGA